MSETLHPGAPDQPPSEASPDAASLHPAPGPVGQTGLIGKVPSEGDFIQRHIADGFADAWFDWLKPAYADAPAVRPGGSLPWVAFFGADLLGPNPLLVIWQDSHDRVGRRFPFALLTPLPLGSDPLDLSRGDVLVSLDALAITCAQACVGRLSVQDVEARATMPGALPAIERAQEDAAIAGIQDDRTAGHVLMWADHHHGADTMILHLLTLFSRQRGFHGSTLWWRPESARGADRGTFAWTATNGLPTAATLSMLMSV